jgi:exopolysaccharide production protein ExoY
MRTSFARSNGASAANAKRAHAPQASMRAMRPASHLAGTSTFTTLQSGLSLGPVSSLLVALAIDFWAEIRDKLALFRAQLVRHHKLVSDATGGQPKRVLDIFVALVAIVLLAPCMLIVAALIKLTLGGPVIFAHARVGQNGQTFPCLKFRTMIVNGQECLDAYLASNPAAAKEWAETHKLRHDPRITRLGHILRISSLDELPQLFNVLRGDMSCVGPRPIVAAELKRYGAHAPEYLAARPGVTGIWQVSGRSSLSYEERIRLDFYYVRHWSMLLDLKILLKTIPAVLHFSETA